MPTMLLKSGARGFIPANAADYSLLQQAILPLQQEIKEAWPRADRHKWSSKATILDLAQVLSYDTAIRYPVILDRLGEVLGAPITLDVAAAARYHALRERAGMLQVPMLKAWDHPLTRRYMVPYAGYLRGRGFELEHFQLMDAALMAAKGGAILGYTMRLGKTRTALAAGIARRTPRILVLADNQHLPRFKGEYLETFGMPEERVLSLAYSKDVPEDGWQKNPATRTAFLNFLRAFGHSGTPEKPALLLVSFHVGALGNLARKSEYHEYPIVKALMNAYRAGCIIVDEAHHAANRETRHGQVFNSLEAPMKILCTGTPVSGQREIQSNLPAWVARGKFRFAYPYLRHFKHPFHDDKSVNRVNNVYDLDGVRDIGHHGYYRPRPPKEDASPDLAFHARTECLLLVRDDNDPVVVASHMHFGKASTRVVEVEMEPGHEDFLLEMREEMRNLLSAKMAMEQKLRLELSTRVGLAQLEEEVRKAMGRMAFRFTRDFFTIMGRLACASTCPWDLKMALRSSLKRYNGRNAKYEKVLEETKKALGEGKKVVLLAFARAYGDRLLRDLEPYGVLEMRSGLTGPEKQDREARFRHDPRMRIALVNPQSAGEGFDFSAAQLLVAADLDPRMTLFTQGLARLNGPRQLKAAEVLIVLHRGRVIAKTPDQDLYENLILKKERAEAARKGKVSDLNAAWEERAKALLA